MNTTTNRMVIPAEPDFSASRAATLYVISSCRKSAPIESQSEISSLLRRSCTVASFAVTSLNAGKIFRESAWHDPAPIVRYHNVVRRVSLKEARAIAQSIQKEAENRRANFAESEARVFSALLGIS